MDVRYSKTISKIIIGFIFTFCYISLYSINVLTGFIGMVFLAGALFELKNETSPFRKAFVFSLIQLGLHTVNIISQFATDNFRFFFDLANAIIMVFVIYNIFDGLKIVLYNCDTDKNPPLFLPFILYIVTIISRAAILFFKDNNIVVYTSMAVCAICFILILAITFTVANIIKKSDYELNKDKLRILYLAPFALVAVIGLSGFLIVNAMSSTSQKAIIYTQADTENAENAAKIKADMIKAGFPENITATLPDSEIEKFDGIYKVNVKTETIEIDGGILNLTATTSYLPLGEVRFLQYFEWDKLPTGKFVDLIGLCIETKKIVMPVEAICDGYVMYDKNGSTYKVDYIDQDIALKYPKAKYKVVPDSENLRGYLALNTTLALPSTPAEYTTSLVYAHQKNMMNFPYADSFSFFRLGRQTEPNLAVFSKLQKIQVVDNYVPKNYKPEDSDKKD